MTGADSAVSRDERAARSSIHPAEKPLADAAPNLSQPVLVEPPRKRFAGERLIFDGEHVRAEWKVLAYFAFWWVTMYWMMWLGVSLFPEPIHGPTLLWRDMYQEFAMAFGAVLPAIVMGRCEGRSIKDFGL